MNDEAFARSSQEYAEFGPRMNERERRLWAGKHAKSLGRGGPTRIAELTGLSRPTIYQGLRELDEPTAQQSGQGSRVRRPGRLHRRLIPVTRDR